MRVKILKEETKTSCGRARVSFPKNCSIKYIDISYATEFKDAPLQKGVTYGVRSVTPPGDYIGVMSYPLVVEALDLLNEYLSK